MKHAPRWLPHHPAQCKRISNPGKNLLLAYVSSRSPFSARETLSLVYLK